MIKKNTVFLNGRKIGTYEFVQKAGSGHINFNGFDPYEAKLTDDQQIVLEWLKWSVEDQKNSPMDAVYLLILGEALISVSLAYIALTNRKKRKSCEYSALGLWNRRKSDDTEV
ncbi:hypothetical protein P7H43_01550 [Enterococcus asini]|uniref:Transmembrane protein n=1 Tax=Enterococcus asini TaxID=57732 RepID=A0AAW8TUU4_9ENTE|nr:hypothetical protein [Enterococcus asini]MDT2809176.1 hypothetical protein [Enterococcus asini]